MKVVLNAAEYESYKAKLAAGKATLLVTATADDVVRETEAINKAIEAELYIGVTAQDAFNAAHPTK